MLEVLVNEPHPAKASGRIRRVVLRIQDWAESVLGAMTLVAVLAAISAVPFLNLLSLGYFLEASARVSRSGRLREGWIGLSGFAAAGRWLLCTWLWLLPLRLIAGLRRDAAWIAADSPAENGLRFLLIAGTLLIGLHLAWAMLRGGSWGHFFWPAPLRFLRWLGAHAERRESFDLLGRLSRGWLALRPVHFFRLGTLGFAGATVWLAPPVLILIASAQVRETGIGALGALIGGIWLGLVALKIPLFQTRFAATGRFRVFFELGPLRAAFSRAPWAFLLALTVSLLFAIPLYLLKIELTPAEIAWLPNLFFVLLAFPGRLLLGWCLARAERRDQLRHPLSCWGARFALVPVAGVYVFVVWLNQYLSWHGTLGLMEQHAFLVPAPMLGL